MIDFFQPVFLPLVIGLSVWVIAWFLIALVLRRNDVADIAWGLEFIAIALFMLFTQEQFTGSLVVTALVLIWGLRLAYHITTRFIKKKEEDPRYAAWRRDWGKWVNIRAFGQVFLLQGILGVIVALPVIVNGMTPRALDLYLITGTVVWIIGFIFESVGDAQLRNFLANTSRTATVMQTGLWKYTRHPNYFGEATMWWGIAIIALSSEYGWIGLLGAATITFLLRFVSGVPMAERSFADNPEFQEYAKKTNAFFPLPPRK